MELSIPLAEHRYMSVKQVADYLHLNEKKIYKLVNEGKIPATKVTGKWMFPRELVDRWILNSTHGGLLNDRLIIGGSDDPLLYRLVVNYGQQTGASALVNFSPCGTRLGLELLQNNRIDVCGIHWGPQDESNRRHPALIRHYADHHQWVVIHLFQRQQGLMVSQALANSAHKPETLFDTRYRWVVRQSGSGTQRYLLETLSRYQVFVDDLQITNIAYSERETASLLVMGIADVAPGAQATAREFGLGYIPLGWESFDLVLLRGIWFRRIFQGLLAHLKRRESLQIADTLGGYDLSRSGDLVWSQE